jgi:hypothetical protein
MPVTKTITMWNGQDIESMSHEELVNTVLELGRLYKESEERANKRSGKYLNQIAGGGLSGQYANDFGTMSRG